MNDEYISSERIDGRTYVNFICNSHRNKGVQRQVWNKLKNGKHGCKYCAGKCWTTEDFKQYIENLNPSIEILGEYTGDSGRVQCKCRECGRIWEPTAHDLKRGSGCAPCSFRKMGLKERASVDQLNARISEVQPNIRLIGEFSGVHKNALFQCLDCGAQWHAHPSNVYQNNTGCPVCRGNSLGEKEIGAILDRYGIKYTTQQTFSDCKHVGALRFDFFLPDENLAIEYDGEGHYQPIDFAGRGTEWAQQQLNDLQLRDQIKTEYCKKNNIRLLRIPYWQKDNLQACLASVLPLCQ